MRSRDSQMSPNYERSSAEILDSKYRADASCNVNVSDDLSSSSWLDASTPISDVLEYRVWVKDDYIDSCKLMENNITNIHPCCFSVFWIKNSILQGQIVRVRSTREFKLLNHLLQFRRGSFPRRRIFVHFHHVLSSFHHISFNDQKPYWILLDTEVKP